MQNRENSKMNKKTQYPSNFSDTGLISVMGHLKIHDPENGEVYTDKNNAIHYENFSIAMAQSISNQGVGFISEMCFGNGGTRVDDTGIIVYLTPNTVETTSGLYNQTYYKTVDANNVADIAPQRNYMQVRHVAGAYYSDVLISCLLDFGEPAGQQAFDNATNSDSPFVFDEIGLRGYSPDGVGIGPLLTHVIFHPVQKSLNRMIQIDYTIRIQSITG